MDRDTLHQAFILHRRPYSNTSLLLECFTEGLGRFPALAKGAMSQRRALGGVLQPFSPLLIRISGRGEVRTLTLGEADGEGAALIGRGLYCGFYLNELLMRLLGRNDPHPSLFRGYRDALRQLAADNDAEPVLRGFEILLLRELGYEPVFDRLLEGGAIPSADGCYHYRIEEGVVAAEPGHRDVVSGRTLLALAGHAAFGADEKRQARGLMRRILRHYLGERPLKSRELFQLIGKSQSKG